MKFSSVILCFTLTISLICLTLCCHNLYVVVELQKKKSTFDAEIKGLTNMQKSQMEFSILQTTINQLGFCLQATQIENQELMDTAKQAFQEVNTLQMGIQQMNIFVGELLEENAKLKKQLKKDYTT